MREGNSPRTGSNNAGESSPCTCSGCLVLLAIIFSIIAIFLIFVGNNSQLSYVIMGAAMSLFIAAMLASCLSPKRERRPVVANRVSQESTRHDANLQQNNPLMSAEPPMYTPVLGGFPQAPTAPEPYPPNPNQSSDEPPTYQEAVMI